MKKPIKFLYLLLIFAITTFIFFFTLSFVVKNDTESYSAVVEVIGWLIIWGAVFLYFIIRKLTTKRSEES